MATNEVQSAAPAGFGLRLAKGKAIHCCLKIPTGSSNNAQGTWGDFGYILSPGPNPYWQGSDITAGSLFDKGTPSWYSASGLRNVSSGALNLVATYGFSWSASPYNDSSTARYLGFSSTDVNPTHNSNRSFGFPVRCVQE